MLKDHGDNMELRVLSGPEIDGVHGAGLGGLLAGLLVGALIGYGIYKALD